MPKPVLGGVEIILYTMIGINGLRIMIKEQIDMFDPKNIIIIAILVVCGLGGTVLTFVPKDVLGGDTSIALSGTGVGVIVAIILNALIPSKRGADDAGKAIPYIDFTPSDFMRIGSGKNSKVKKYTSVDNETNNANAVKHIHHSHHHHHRSKKKASSEA